MDKNSNTGDQGVVDQDDKSGFACHSGDYDRGTVSQKKAILDSLPVQRRKERATFSDIYD